MTENILSWRLTLIKEGENGYRLVKAPLAPFMALLIPQLTETRRKREIRSQAAQTLFVIYIRDSIALRFEPFKRMYETI